MAFASRESVGLQGITGLGQAACPSQIQAAGITDCTDPCQVGSAACPAATSPVVLTAAQLANIKSDTYAQGQLDPLSTCPAGATCSIIAGISDTTIYIGGAILGGLLLMMTMGGGGRRR